MTDSRPLGIRALPLALFAVLVAAVVTAGLVLFVGAREHEVTAYFTQSKGLYVGDDVQMLGVPVGTVTDIRPEPGRVRVTMTYDSDQRVPADAKAVLVAPSLVTVRHVALAPAYDGGPIMEDGATIPVSRTAVPVEWDEIKAQLDRLAVALGPRGANANGSLSRLLDTSAANLHGRGGDLNQTLTQLSEAMATLSDNRGNLFGTVRNLQVFVDALANSDAQVYEFNNRLSSVSALLNDDRDELASALHGVERAFTDVNGFLAENRDTLRTSVDDLTRVSDTLARNRQQLADVLQTAPTGLSNFYNILDPQMGGFTGSMAMNNMQAPGLFVCSAIFNFGGTADQCRTALEPLAKLAAMQPPPVGISPIERNGTGNQEGAGPSRPWTSAPPGNLPGLLSPGGDR